jgi:acyl-CoA oxidase
METTAVWDQDKQVFVINTPTLLSQKYWITNGAYHANHAVVFGQTIVNNKNEGINAFIIRLRDNENKLCPGVTIDDMGCKQGMNGVDNARIILKNVEAKRENLLNKLADVSPNGKFSSQISNRRQRFIAATNRLLSGRVCIAAMLISSTKLVLLIANKYASVRLSNGKTGKSDTPISKFQLFQNQIVPLISRTIVYNIGLHHVGAVYSDYLLNSEKYDAAQFNNVVRLVCVIKPMVAWLGNEVGNICRERTGGQGYLSINRIEELIAVAHAAITAEGDSAVLMQKVSKEYVEDFAKNLLAPPELTESADTLRKKTDIFNYETLINLIKLRESLLLEAMTMKTITNKNEIYQVWMLNESDLIQDLAKTYGERMCLEQSYIKLKGTR